MNRARLFAVLIGSALLMAGGAFPAAQTLGEKERFTAVAVVNNARTSGAGIVQIDITRWSTAAEREALIGALKKGSAALLDMLQDTRPVGTIKTPDSLGYDLHYAHQTALPDGGRRIVIATDRPIGFWEAANRPRTIEYPFTVIQMEIGKDGKGKGTMSYATRIIPAGNTIVLENFDTQPVMLTEVRAEKHT